MSWVERLPLVVLVAVSSVGVLLLSVAAVYAAALWTVGVVNAVSCADAVCTVAVVGAIDSAVLVAFAVFYGGVLVAERGFRILRVLLRGLWVGLGEVAGHGLLAIFVAGFAQFILMLHSVAAASIGVTSLEYLGVVAELGVIVALVCATEAIAAFVTGLFGRMVRR